MRIWVFVLLASLGQGIRAEVVIDSIAIHPDGQVEIRFPLAAGSYYILRSGPTPASIASPTALRLGGAGTGEFLDAFLNQSSSNRFYQIQQVPLSEPLDLDVDGIDDATELRFGRLLKPLNPADGAADPDEDGMSTAAELRLGRNPFIKDIQLTTFTSSPSPSEAGVSVNRETLLRFSRPLAADTKLSSANLRAVVAGRTLLTRVDLSSDRLTASLFYLEPVPGASRVRVSLDASAVRDDTGELVDADADGNPGGVGVVEFDTFGNFPVPNTAVIGQVFASELGTNDLGRPINRPLAGVIITVDGAEESLRAMTDAEGRFKLLSAPSGRVFVHIDGRPAVGSQWPDGPYYPVVGKAWEVVAGKTNNLAGGTGEIFLPLIAADALQPVSSTLDTTIGFPAETLQKHPELAGVQLTIPSNSLFADTGSRGGRVGIAPVPADRLPGPLPEGIRLPLVITVQTDGPQNLDRPAPVRFPNLPDPDTGIKLPPGAKTALISFNHDKGDWEVAGSMTISADGQFAMSDPGSGIRQPGWHGTSPVASGSGGGYRSGAGSNGGGSGLSGNGNVKGGFGTQTSIGVAGDNDTIPPEDNEPDLDDTEPPVDPNDSDNGGGGGGGSSCDSARFADPFEVFFQNIIPAGAGGLIEPFGKPKIHQRRSSGVYTDLLGNQHILLDIGFDPDDTHQVSWSAPNGEPKIGSSRQFRTRFPLNYTTLYKTNFVCVEVSTVKPDGTKEKRFFRMSFEVVPNSGSHFEALFRSPKDTSQLAEPFKGNLERFIAALKAGDATVKIGAAFRAQKRAYLMHFSDIVANGTPAKGRAPAVAPGLWDLIPDYDPNLPKVVQNCNGSEGCVGPLPISWVHLDENGREDRTATIAAAMALYSKYGIASRAAFPTDRHGTGRAVDMYINFSGVKTFALPPGQTLSDGSTSMSITAVQCHLIKCNPVFEAPRTLVGDQHCNTKLWELGQLYGVGKLFCDMPHWSFDGN